MSASTSASNYDDMGREVDSSEEGDNVTTIPCCFCGAPTTWDPTYEDLCCRCIRAENE